MLEFQSLLRTQRHQKYHMAQIPRLSTATERRTDRQKLRVAKSLLLNIHQMAHYRNSIGFFWQFRHSSYQLL